MTEKLAEIVLEFMGRSTYRPLKQHELAKALGIPLSERRDFRQVLRALEEAGAVVCGRKNLWALPDARKQLIGIFKRTGRAQWVVMPESGGAPIQIAEEDLADALEGDKVMVALIPSRKREPAPGERSGRVTRVLERGKPVLAGILKITRYYAYVIPRDPRLGRNVRLLEPPETLTQLDGRLVVVRLATGEPAARGQLCGELVEDLGAPDAPGADVLALFRGRGVAAQFPAATLAAANAIAPEIAADARDHREDLRPQVTFTIDPVDARDFDDAVSLEPLPGGFCKLGVHIADVAHFVEPGSTVDREALHRGNSTYLVDRVIPMLPPHLTHDVCSLKPQEERLTHSVELLLDDQANVVEARTFPSVIRSAARLNYEQVQGFFDRQATDGIPEAVAAKLAAMRPLARLMRARRMANGAIDLAMPEVRCELDDHGQPVALRRRLAFEAYQLIEEFMLAANQAVAQKIFAAEYPCLYRIHDAPEEEQWERMAVELQALHIRQVPRTRSDLNQVARAAAGTPLEHMVNIALLRNLKRACYRAQRRDHFGLAFSHYTHFTSPIRRYPDLVVHRVLRAVEGRKPHPYSKSELERIAEQCSATERLASELESESLELKRVAYYHRLLAEGETGPYRGVVVSFCRRGFFVELESSLQQGLVHFNSLTDDDYLVDDEQCSAVGRRHHRTWRMGQLVDVNIVRVDEVWNRVDFQICETMAVRRKTTARRGRKGR